MFTFTKKFNLPVWLIVFVALALCVQSCKKSRSDMAKTLFIKTKNKVFRDVTPEGFAQVLQKMLDSEKTIIPYPKVIAAYYDDNDYTPTFVMDHLFNGDLENTLDYYQKAGDHGLNPKVFKAAEIDTLIHKIRDKKRIKTLDEAYHDLAQLELLCAGSLINYSNALQFGAVDPHAIYARYYTATKHPDSVSMVQVFRTGSLKQYLDSIQPKNPQYLALQKAYLGGYQAPGLSKEETRRMLLVNLERLRWKNKPKENKYVIVNIPDYTLDVMDSRKSVLHMKVCVGEGRNKTNGYTLINYTDTCKTDKPFTKETPQLNSVIHSVQVNPVWNIPQSIVTKEIVKQAADDRFYLANKGINVYKNGVKIANTEDINWAAAAKEGSDYEFKQAPGADNSLGKIKFLFNNKSSVYLHDTPMKSAFNKTERDVSHGCVRLGDPQGLALTLFGAGPKYDEIAKDMAEDNPDPTTIGLSPKVPVYITYITCWADETGTLQFRPDVYGLDVVLYDKFINSIK